MTLQGLTRMAPGVDHELSLAESLIISEDKKTYTFKLKKAYWSDETLITSYDFEKSWKEVLNPQFTSPVTHLFFVIKNAQEAFEGKLSLNEVGIYTPDESTLVVELETPIPYFLDLTSFNAFFPVKYSNLTNKEKSRTLLNSGPFLMRKWQHGNEILLEKNPYFWDAKNIKLEGIHINIIESNLTSLNMFENREIDFIGAYFSPLPIDTINFLSKQGSIHSSPIGATTMLCFNLNKFPYNNNNIRKAIAYGIDRKKLVENITQLNEVIATGFIPPILKNHRETLFFEDGNQDLAREVFKTGLKELGITKEDFPQMIISYYKEDSYAKVAQAIQQQLQETLGINIQLAGYELQYFLYKLKKKDFQVAEFSWVAQYNDPMNIFERFKLKNNSKNYPGWENSTYINLLNSSQHSCSKEERLEILERAEDLFIEEMPLTCLYHWNSNYLMQPYVKGFYMSPIGSIHWEFVYIDE
jgi:oligopeptide transport system substrate-binding protein